MQCPAGGWAGGGPFAIIGLILSTTVVLSSMVLSMDGAISYQLRRGPGSCWSLRGVPRGSCGRL